MRRKDRAISREEAEAVLAGGLYGVLSLNGSDGPYGVPVCHVLDNGKVYFHCAIEGRKAELMKADARVSFCVVGQAEPLPAAFSMRYKSVVLSGRAVKVADDTEKLAALAALVLKYSGAAHAEAGRAKALAALSATAVYRIEPEELSGKARV